MSRRAQSLPPDTIEKPERSRCLTAVCISWKVISCIVSHVTLVSLVVAYCIGGALLFQHLEGEHELQVKRDIIKIRNNVTDDLWEITATELFLAEENWTELAFDRLQKFEKEILRAMKTEGWDGDEKDQQLQWTFFGALFYSIIVITTIGYGHIAPRTDWGKVTTIFYAILGIPLMLLCLSNIGDVMATSFRFLYWKICCYACTRGPPRRRPRSTRGTSKQVSHRHSSRSQPPSTIRRSIRVSQRSADSGYVPYYAGIIHAHSDPELRCNENFEDFTYNQKDWRFSQEQEVDKYRNWGRNYSIKNDNNHWQPRSPNANRFSNHIRNCERFNERRSVECGQNYKLNSSGPTIPLRPVYSSSFFRGQSIGRVYSQTLPLSSAGYKSQPRHSKTQSKSVDPKLIALGDVDNTSIFCNQHAFEIGDNIEFVHRKRCGEKRGSRGSINNRGKRFDMFSDKKASSVSRYLPSQGTQYGDRSEIPKSVLQADRPSNPNEHICEDYSNDEIEMKPIRKGNQLHIQLHVRKEKPAPLPPSPRIMSPMGFAVHRQARMSIPSDNDSYYGDEWDSYGDLLPRNRPVPIWLCVFLVISYIIAGAFLFSNWEKWPFLDSVYFCFITLTTIGFGDFVPAQGVKENSKESIALCSLYLLFGISLLAMSFNLVQEEVISNVKEVARRLGILKEEEIDD